ncbi:MAG TPA: GDCCVxC domain-containing (seleno)protein [Ignavibacteria bacterium]|nr:GDCCVxC domain-containing (seleno)protein [Ignavibacteria bacterium]
MNTVKANLKCPECNNITQETIPDNCCVFFFECKNCNKIFKPLKNDCCVFCSYSDKKCKYAQNCCAN